MSTGTYHEVVVDPVKLSAIAVDILKVLKEHDADIFMALVTMSHLRDKLLAEIGASRCSITLKEDIPRNLN